MLALLYYQNCSTTGCQGLLSPTWLGSTDHCSWLGVNLCINVSRVSKDGSKTYDESRVSVIDLCQKQLSGELPFIIMAHLDHLFLNQNQLSGSMSVVNIPSLTELKLYTNNFTGTLPRFD